MKKSPSHDNLPNKLCGSCRRTCKQLPFAVVSKCPRYYPYRDKQIKAKKWVQPELFLSNRVRPTYPVADSNGEQNSQE